MSFKKSTTFLQNIDFLFPKPNTYVFSHIPLSKTAQKNPPQHTAAEDPLIFMKYLIIIYG